MCLFFNFCFNSNPNDEAVGVVWEPATKDRFCYLNVGRTFSFHIGWIAEDRMKMWQHLFDRYPDIRKKYSQIYVRRVITENEKIYLEPDIQLLFGSDD